MSNKIVIRPVDASNFAIEAHKDDVVDTYFHGSCLTLAMQCLNLALKDHNCNVVMSGWDGLTKPLRGAIFNVFTVDTEGIKVLKKRFFRETRDPFASRKAYSLASPADTVSFDLIGV
jgi:hypothetical protein